MSETQLVSYNAGSVEVSLASDFMPVFDIPQALQRRNALVNFTKQIMTVDLDFGKIPGSPRPCLYKAGAEKLCTFFGLIAEFDLTECVEDWTGDKHSGEPFFYFRYKCRLRRSGRLVGEGEGSCNSWESKYRYRWVDESFVIANGIDKTKLAKRGGTISEFEFAVSKAETSGRYGKPAEYWQAFKDAIASGTARKIERPMADKSKKPAWEIDGTQYRLPNPDVADVVNTCQKMGQKRALIAATLISVNASEYFTQDLEDRQPEQPEHGHIDIGDNPPNSTSAQQHVAEQKLKADKAEPVKQWHWRDIEPHFEPLIAKLGRETYNTLLKQKGYKGLSDVPSREAARALYAFLETEAAKSDSSEPAPPAPVATDLNTTAPPAPVATDLNTMPPPAPVATDLNTMPPPAPVATDLNTMPPWGNLIKEFGSDRYLALLFSQGYAPPLSFSSTAVAWELYRTVEAKGRASVETTTAPVPASSAPKTNPAKQELFARMVNIKTVVNEFQTLKKDLIELVGEDRAMQHYRAVLSHHGVEHSNQFRSMQKARQCAGQLFDLIGEIQTKGDTHAAGIVDDDIPGANDHEEAA